ncbi:hypothetical protein Ae505Ps2_3324c [Pseudonocardia sp. Ae505_Ps2]|nr:hypothetical protein Ae505Ps2_3324c [Pseudonocardia sp. Ae505_Ps2]
MTRADRARWTSCDHPVHGPRAHRRSSESAAPQPERMGGT